MSACGRARGRTKPPTLVANKFAPGRPTSGGSLEANEEGSGMNPSDKCRVDDCDRRAGASVIQDSLPGPLPLCATHTEDFRMNSSGWTISWENLSADPASVKAAAVAAAECSGPDPGEVRESNNSPRRGIRSRLQEIEPHRSKYTMRSHRRCVGRSPDRRNDSTLECHNHPAGQRGDS